MLAAASSARSVLEWVRCARQPGTAIEPVRPRPAGDREGPAMTIAVAYDLAIVETF